jgi:hypothetical protein
LLLPTIDGSWFLFDSRLLIGGGIMGQLFGWRMQRIGGSVCIATIGLGILNWGLLVGVGIIRFLFDWRMLWLGFPTIGMNIFGWS